MELTSGNIAVTFLSGFGVAARLFPILTYFVPTPSLHFMPTLHPTQQDSINLWEMAHQQLFVEADLGNQKFT